MPLLFELVGADTGVIPQLHIDGSTFTVAFDTAAAQSLYLRFSVTSKSSGSIDTTALKNSLAEQLLLGIYELADITTITDLIHAINPDLIVYNIGVSNVAASYINSTRPASLKNYWTLTAANISIV